MGRIMPDILSQPQRLETLEQQPVTYRPPACPHCGLARPWGHGCYQHKAGRRPAKPQYLGEYGGSTQAKQFSRGVQAQVQAATPKCSNNTNPAVLRQDRPTVPRVEGMLARR